MTASISGAYLNPWLLERKVGNIHLFANIGAVELSTGSLPSWKKFLLHFSSWDFEFYMPIL